MASSSRNTRAAVRLMVGAVAAVVITAGASALIGAKSAAGSVGIPPLAAALAGVGPVFGGRAGDRHFCTASVVASSSRDLILTAAHCVAGTGAGLYFAPGFHDGQAPFGYWRVTAAYVDPSWARSHTPQADYAFLRVAPAEPGHSVPIQEIVGGDALAPALRIGARVVVTGYPAGQGGGPVTCGGRTYQRSGFPAFDCPGFADGTSGGPWLASSGSTPAVVGVIGGLEQGGCSSSVSYSARLGPAARALLARAEAGGPSDVVPAAAGAGCAS